MRQTALRIKAFPLIIFFLTGVSLKTYILPQLAFCEEPFRENSIDLSGLKEFNPVNLTKNVGKDSLAFVTAPTRFTSRDWLIIGITLGGNRCADDFR